MFCSSDCWGEYYRSKKPPTICAAPSCEEAIASNRKYCPEHRKEGWGRLSDETMDVSVLSREGLSVHEIASRMKVAPGWVQNRIAAYRAHNNIGEEGPKPVRTESVAVASVSFLRKEMTSEELEDARAYERALRDLENGNGNNPVRASVR